MWWGGKVAEEKHKLSDHYTEHFALISGQLELLVASHFNSHSLSALGLTASKTGDILIEELSRLLHLHT